MKTKKLLKELEKNPAKGASLMASALAKNPRKLAKSLAKDPTGVVSSVSKAAARAIGGKHKKRTRRVIQAALATALAVGGAKVAKGKLADANGAETQAA